MRRNALRSSPILGLGSVSTRLRRRVDAATDGVARFGREHRIRANNGIPKFDREWFVARTKPLAKVPDHRASPAPIPDRAKRTDGEATLPIVSPKVRHMDSKRLSPQQSLFATKGTHHFFGRHAIAILILVFDLGEYKCDFPFPVTMESHVVESLP